MTDQSTARPAPGVPLVRRRDDRILAGVCAGLAAHLGLPVVWTRGGMVVLALFGGAGAILYGWLWITVPWAGAEGVNDLGDGVKRMRRALMKPAVGGSGSGEASAPTAGEPGEEAEGSAAPTGYRRWPVAELLLGGALLIAGLGLVLTRLGVELDLAVMLPAMLVLVGVGLTWWQIADRARPERNLLPRVLGALALVAVGILTFFVTARQPSAFTVIAAALAVLAGVALALAPWLLRINRELIEERSARARESERAEIAAHLHDSVLQTLAAIQQRSEPGSDVARIARGQERELREWLFRAADGVEAPSREAVDVELRAHAAALETDFPVRFDVVAVGASTAAGELVPEPVVAAAREAMLNAAKHAGGEVGVYIEATTDSVSIDVTDRGSGLGGVIDSTDPTSLENDGLPDGRMGVRESIVGRMERAGGVARIVPGPGGAGTSVRLSMPLPHSDAEGA